jgi:hypothetical protein
MTPLIIDDFIPEVYQDSILYLLTGPEFGWTFNDESAGYGDMDVEKYFHVDVPTKNHIQFRHTFVKENELQSDFLKYIGVLVACFENTMEAKVKYTKRIKSNLLVSSSGPTLQPPHVDGLNMKNGVIDAIGKYSLLYYVNDSDGDTILYDKYFLGEPVGLLKVSQTISPKKGRAVIFDSNQIHSASCPKINDSRIVINCIFEI